MPGACVSDSDKPVTPARGSSGAVGWNRADGRVDGRVEERAGGRAEHAGVQPAAPPPRRWTSRLSAGHLVMLTAALAAVVLNYGVLRARDDSVRVAVAAETLRAGTPVTPGSFDFVDVRVDDALAGTMLTPGALAEVEGWVATGAVDSGELVRRSDLKAPSAPAAQRAMSLPVDPTHAVAGALEAGDRVDVIEVREEGARYLVTDTEVLAVGDVARGGLEGLSGFSITLAVDDEAALRLARALHDGALDIVRSTGAEPTTPRAEPPGPEDPTTPDAGDRTTPDSGSARSREDAPRSEAAHAP